MLAKSVPPCICGDQEDPEQDYRPGGGQISGGFSQSGFTCKRCNRSVMAVDANGCGPYIIFPTDSHGFSNEDFEYLNGVLLRATRDAEARRKNHIEHVQREFIAEIVTKHDLDPDEITAWGALPDEIKNQYRHKFDAFIPDAFREWAEQHGHPVPPQLPPTLRIKMRELKDGAWEWVEVDHAKSAEMDIPRDPIRGRRDEYWGGIFAELAKLLEVDQVERKEIPNRYYPDRFKSEPWYEFEAFGVTFVVGPRNRVDAVHVLGKDGAKFACKRIRELSERDKTTFTANDAWKPEVDEASSVEVHAWTKDKLIEYFGAIFADLRGDA